MFFRSLLTFCLLLATTIGASATTWYVDYAAGSDTLDGLSPTVNAPSGPFQHFGQALSVASTGDTIRLAAGTYFPELPASGFGNIIQDSLVVIGAPNAGSILNAQQAGVGLSINARHVRLENVELREALVGLSIQDDADSVVVLSTRILRCDLNFDDFAIYIHPTASIHSLRFEELVIDSVSNGIYYDTPAGDTIMAEFIGDFSLDATYHAFGRSGLGLLPTFEDFKTQMNSLYHLKDVRWQTGGVQTAAFLFSDLRSVYDWLQIVANTSGLSLDSATCTNFDSTTWYLHAGMRNEKTLPLVQPKDTLFFLQGNHRKGQLPTFLPINQPIALVTGDTIGQTTIDARFYDTGMHLMQSGLSVRNLRVFGAEQNGLLVENATDLNLHNLVLEESKVPPTAGSQQLRLANVQRVTASDISILNYYGHTPLLHGSCDSILLRDFQLDPLSSFNDLYGLMLSTDSLLATPAGDLTRIQFAGSWESQNANAALVLHDQPSRNIELQPQSNFTLSVPQDRRIFRTGLGNVSGLPETATRLGLLAELSNVYSDSLPERTYYINGPQDLYFNLQFLADRAGNTTNFLLKRYPDLLAHDTWYVVDMPADSPFVALRNADTTRQVYAAGDTLFFYDPLGLVNYTDTTVLPRPAVIRANASPSFAGLEINHVGDTTQLLSPTRITEHLSLTGGLLQPLNATLDLSPGVTRSVAEGRVISPIVQLLGENDTTTYSFPYERGAYRPLHIRLLEPPDSGTFIYSDQVDTIRGSLQPQAAFDTLKSHIQWIVDISALATSGDTIPAELTFTFAPEDSLLQDSLADDTNLVMLQAFGTSWRVLPTVRLPSDSSRFRVQTGLFGFNQFQLGRVIPPDTTPIDTTPVDTTPELPVFDAEAFPTFLSPDGDGFNDTFTHPILDAAESYSLLIFNPAGQLVYERANSPERFSGKGDNGQELSSGTYYYVLKLTLPGATEEMVKSYFTLRR